MILRKSKLFLVLLIVLLVITGCKKDENLDALKFKKEYEKYNESLTKLNISKDNPFVYSNSESIKKSIEEDKALAIFYGNPSDELSRKMVKSIIESCSSNDLSKVYYIETKDNETYQLLDIIIDKKPVLVEVVKKGISNTTYEENNVNLIIESVARELNTCDVNTGC